MTNKRTSILILLVFIIAFYSCKKGKRFPEDPKKSRKSADERLLGTWQLNDYTLNGNSIMDVLNTKLNNISKGPYNIKNLNIQYLKINNDDSHQMYFNNLPLNPSSDIFINETYILFNLYQIPITKYDYRDSIKKIAFVSPLRFDAKDYAKWTVTKLYNKDFWLTLQTDTGEFKLFLIK